MSASVYFQPIKHNVVPNGPVVNAALRTVFGDPEWFFTASDFEKLSVLESLWTNNDNPYTMLISAIAEYGEIRVWSEH